MLGGGGAARAQTPPPATSIQDRLIAAFQRDQMALQQYVHREHVITIKDGARDARTLRVWYVEGREVEETIALDNRLLSPGELAAEHQRALQRARDAAARPPSPAGMLRFQGHAYPFARLANDYIYGDATTRTIGGRTIWVYQARPNPNAHPQSREEKLLLHTQGEVWVDAGDMHVVRIAVHTMGNVRYALGLVAVIHQANLELQLQRQKPDVWLPAKAGFSLRATILLVDTITRSKEQTYFDYQPDSAR
ncbi:MAG: hypothetical protein ACRD01_12140 [Terriglobales bacterium]